MWITSTFTLTKGVATIKFFVRFFLGADGASSSVLVLQAGIINGCAVPVCRAGFDEAALTT